MIPTAALLPVLDTLLLELLRSLTPDEWNAQTVASKWKVKDVAAHLLDTNMRVLSMLRDGHATALPEIRSYRDLVDYLNELNADWVRAMQRVSPQMLIPLLETTGKAYCDYYASLDPDGIAHWPVAWAGQQQSTNATHIARDYTEKWHHQQQIRDAVNKPGLMTRELFVPLMETFMLALPYTFRNIAARHDDVVKITIGGEIGGSWLTRFTQSGWIPETDRSYAVTAEAIIPAEISWKLFTKSVRPVHIMDSVTLLGDPALAAHALELVAVMA